MVRANRDMFQFASGPTKRFFYVSTGKQAAS